MSAGAVMGLVVVGGGWLLGRYGPRPWARQTGTGLIVAGLGMAVMGCAGDTALRARVADAQVEWSKAQMDALREPMVEVTTPDGTRVVVRQPLGAGGYQGPQLPDDPWARVADRGMSVLGTGLGLWLGGRAASGLATAIIGGTADVVRELGNPAPSIFTTITSGDTVTGSFNPVQGDTVTGSFNPVETWENGGRIDSPDTRTTTTTTTTTTP